MSALNFDRDPMVSDFNRWDADNARAEAADYWLDQAADRLMDEPATVVDYLEHLTGCTPAASRVARILRVAKHKSRGPTDPRITRYREWITTRPSAEKLAERMEWEQES